MLTTRPEAKALRKFIIRRMMTHQKPGSGSRWDRGKDKKMAADRLLEWEWIGNVLSGVPHVIVGGMAVNQFAPPRATEDLDIALAVGGAQLAMTLLGQQGFELAGAFSLRGWTLRRGVAALDLLELDEAWFIEALQQPYRVGPFPVLDLPYLILMKMAASRGTDIGDIQRMLHGADEPRRMQVRDAFHRFAPQDLEDLEQLIVLSDAAW